MQCYLTIHHGHLIRVVGEGEFHLLRIRLNWVNIKVIPLCITFLMNRTLAPVKLNGILTSQHIYIHCNVDIQLVETTQHRDCRRRNRLVEDTYTKCVSISVQETILIATAEDIELNTSLFTQIVVDADRLNLTILQWSQIYMVPTSLNIREFDSLAEVQFLSILTTCWYIWSNHCEGIYIQHKMTISQHADISSVNTLNLISIFIPRQINHTCCDRIHAIKVAIHSNGTVDCYQCRTRCSQ